MELWRENGEEAHPGLDKKLRRVHNKYGRQQFCGVYAAAMIESLVIAALYMTPVRQAERTLPRMVTK